MQVARAFADWCTRPRRASSTQGKDNEGENESLPYAKHFEAYYSETKATAEKAVLAANGPDLATVSLRPHLIFGPGDPHLIPRIIDAARRPASCSASARGRSRWT